MLKATSSCDHGKLLPEYTLKPASPLLPFISDVSLSLWLPFIVYWAFSGIFQAVESSSLGARLQPFNTPTEMTMRNRVSKTYAFFYILFNFAIQGTIAWGLSKLGGEELVGREEYDIATWALRIRFAQRWIPGLLSIIGIDSRTLAENVAGTMPAISDVLAGGKFYATRDSTQTFICSGLTNRELSLASIVYYYFVPALQFWLAFNITDIWQYFGHRLLHEWRWLYRHVHSVHHQLYVPWSWAAFYMHPVESILLDGVSVALAFPAAQLTLRQGMCFTTIVTFKAICDHAGYEIPWNPVYAFPYANDVNFHNLHHQSWGLKHNFGIYSLFWDWLFGTLWLDQADANRKYAKYRHLAEEQHERKSSKAPKLPNSNRLGEIETCTEQ